MGNRRMMSKTITHSQRFLKLPIEAQALYFHMLQNTDDDGITEVFPILKLLSVDETLLTCLVEARLIKQLNNELVYHILDFKEQNRIDKKRYKKSIYHDLLNVNNDETKIKAMSSKMCNKDTPNIIKENRVQKKQIQTNINERQIKKNSNEIMEDYPLPIRIKFPDEAV
ncbi:hypothetical protein [Streptococcus suis]|uniref:hypothetical protein n=1 Tax=Streptococcus suis TaxID=1307 RepID=UPI000CF3DFF3|nr:hypothetical protein [Streptococcus suis]